MTVDLPAATTFLHATARLLERHRFAHLFEGASAAPVLHALRAYRNPDGGFGHAIEPDMRAPVSQPVGAHTAMEILHEAGADDDPMIGPAADWLASVSRDDGGVPFALESARPYPRSPIWQPSETSSLIQTAANAAALHALAVDHPWLEPAGELVFRRAQALDLAAVDRDPGLGYELRFAVAFLDVVPDEARANATLDALAPGLETVAAAEPDPSADLVSPLEVSPAPGLRSRRFFDDAVIDRHLDVLESEQREDGGWDFPWPRWNDAAALEWRGVVTLEALKRLRANGRL